jgi:hypothetical protein
VRFLGQVVASAEVALDRKAGDLIEALAEGHRAEGIGTQRGVFRVDVAEFEAEFEKLEEANGKPNGTEK